jgi:ssDNA-binding Zn-finger/Zn-ribbon topoisomerase 1
MHVRVCPDCGEEYRPEIAVCADCGGVLEDRHEGEAISPSRRVPAAPTAPPPPDLSGHRAVFSTSQARNIVPLAEALRKAGLAFFVLETPGDVVRPQATYGLLVRDEDGARALRAIAPLLAADADPDRLHAVETAFRAQGGYETCPACEVALPEGARECPECGLALLAETDPGEDG